MWGVACLPPYTEYKPQPMRDLVEIWADFPAFKERDTDGLLDAIMGHGLLLSKYRVEAG